MLQEITTWYAQLDPLEKIFWSCAIVSSVIFAIQMILTLIGMDGSDVDVQFDTADFGDLDTDTMDTGGALSLFSIRNLINFLLGFGWAGVSFYGSIRQPLLLILLSLLCGAAFVWMFFIIKRQTKKLEANGAFDIQRCKGLTARVYLRIPAARTGRGKVQVSVSGSVHELDALTDSSTEIASGTTIRIDAVIDGETLLVSPI